MKKISRRSFLKVSGTMAAAGALAACGGSADSPASSAAPASDSASASGSSELPSSTTEANTGELNPGNFDENSVFSITGTENAFAPCLGWGPGVSGCSLKSVIAAASLLQWAEDARMSSRLSLIHI